MIGSSFGFRVDRGEEYFMDGIIISVINNKGGCGKTTTAVNLAHALAREGQEVLLVDMDSQCNATDILVGKIKIDKSLVELLDPNGNDLALQRCIYRDNRTNIDFLPSTPTLAALEPTLIRTAPQSLNILRDRLRDYAKANYDFTIIDNPPNLGTFVLCSLTASDFVIVPNEAGSKYSLEGLIKAVEFIEDIRMNWNSHLRFLRLLITKVDRRMSVCKSMIAYAKRLFPPDRVFETIIPVSTEFQKAELAGETIFAQRTAWAVARSYKALAKEILTILGKDAKKEDTSAISS